MLLRFRLPALVALASTTTLALPAAAQLADLSQLRRMLPPPKWGASFSPEFGDLDGDGDLDLYLAKQAEDRVMIWDADGGYRELPGASPVSSYSRDVAIGDVDADGDNDVVLATSDRNELLLNLGSGTFFHLVSGTPNLDETSHSIELGDMDQDGFLDAVIGQQTVTDRVYINNGAGRFSSTVPLNNSNITNGLALGDVDKSGTLDIVLATGGLFFEENELYLNAGGAVLNLVPGLFAALPSWSESADLGDVDNDGNLDIAFGNSGFGGGGFDELYLGDGAGGFTHVPFGLTNNGYTTEGLRLADVDGDDDLDALMLSGNTNQPDKLYLNDGSGTFTESVGMWESGYDNAWSFDVDDIDQDGDPDVYISTTGDDRLFLNDGTGHYTEVAQANPIDGDYTADVVLGDADGDGDLDAFLANDIDAPDRLWLNNGAGVFDDGSDLLPPHVVGDSRGAEFEDFDGDGDDDILVVSGGKNRLFEQVASGQFEYTVGDTPSDLLETYDVVSGDLDGDGDRDAVVGNDGFWDQVYLNDGTGDLANAFGALPQDSSRTRELALGDLDLDGSLDLVRGLFGSVGDEILTNDGAGVFTPIGQTLSTTASTYSVGLFDMEQDGDLDVYIGESSDDKLFRNDLTHGFTNVSSQLPPIANRSKGLGFADFDGDGDTDVYIAIDWTLTPDYLLENDGTGVFTDSMTPLPSENSGRVAVGDLDGDGSLDVFVAERSSQSVVLFDLREQLAWRGTARLGKPLTLDVYGPPNESWLLFFSLAKGEMAFPPFGTLYLDQGSAITLGAGFLDAEGRASATFPVPAAPILLGLSAYWQGLVGFSARFTNLEVTTVSGL